jgi:hypothetical protein
VGELGQTLIRAPSFEGSASEATAVHPVTYSCIMHRDIVDIDIFNDVILANILAERTDRDAVRSVAPEVLNQDIGAIWLEGYAVLFQCQLASLIVA